MRRSRNGRSKPGSIRIIGGTWRGRQITVADRAGLRPTPDRVRETLFNWLAPVLPGAACLDLYAGSGVLGLEALSRGAGSLTLVESNAAIVAAIAHQCRELGAEPNIVESEAAAFLGRTDIGPFDIVFVDPPYSEDVVPVISQLLPRLSPGARLYLERRHGDAWPDIGGLKWVRRATAGDVDYGLGITG